MANMTYCRFENTLEDLNECYENLGIAELSEGEQQARMRLVRLCALIASEEDMVKELYEEFKTAQKEGM